MNAYVLTGFLGVGKTTMMKNSIANYFSDKHVAVIVNEFGEIGIDGTVLKNVHSEVLEISEGCICCKLAQEFESGVIEIMQKYNPDILFVETSGASEPFPIFLSLQNLGISVEGVICLIDAKHFNEYKENNTAKYQIGGSNILVLNKIDLVDEHEKSMIAQEVLAIKDAFDIKNNLTGEKVFQQYKLYESSHAEIDSAIFEGNLAPEQIASIAKEYTHTDHTVNDKIVQNVVYVKNIPFARLDELLQSMPSSIIRVKGIVLTEDVPNALIVNSAFGNVTYDEMADYDAASILIFIGSDITKDVASLCEKHDFLYQPKFKLTP